MSRLTKIFMTLAMLAVFGLAAPVASADDFAEVGDAPSTLPGQSATGGTNPLTGITGTLLAGGQDADVFRIFITNPALFSATTIGGTTIDTQLFLFSATGVGIVGNDDSGVGLQSTIPVGFAGSGALAAGEYLLAISSFDRDPIDGSGLEIFTDGFSGLQTPIAGRGPLAGFGGVGGGAGAYRISLTGAQFVGGGGTPVPEPATMILLGTGLAGIAAKVRRRRKVSND